MTQSKNSIILLDGKNVNYVAYIRGQDCSTTLFESVQLSLATMLVQLWKSAKAKGQKQKSCCNKPLVTKQNS
jgi:hypothetical protein